MVIFQFQYRTIIYQKKITKKLTIWLNCIRPSGIVLSGGSDIGEYKLRDIQKITYKAFFKIGIPIFGFVEECKLLGLILM